MDEFEIITFSMKAVRSVENRAYLPNFHRECNDLEFIHQLSALEKPEINLLRRLVGMLLCRLNEITSIGKLFSNITKLLEDVLPFFNFPHRFENVRSSNLIFIGKLVQIVCVIVPAIVLRWFREPFKNILPK